MSRRARWHPEDDPEYMAEMEKAMRSTSWGCVLFIVGLLLAGISVLVLSGAFFSFGPLK